MKFLPTIIREFPVAAFVTRAVSFILWFCLLVSLCGFALLGGVVLTIALRPDALLSKETFLILFLVVAVSRTAWVLSKRTQ